MSRSPMKLMLLLWFAPSACATSEQSPTVHAAEARQDLSELSSARARMVDEQLAARSIRDPRVLDAMRKVPRHELVPAELRGYAYTDQPLPIGHGQTISQPYVVALMTELLKPERDDKVLEIGTGSGYQAAVLAELAAQVYTIEIVKPLAQRAAEKLRELGYENVHVKAGDGYQGWPEQAPFDAVILTAAPPDKVPEPLLEQLKTGGRLVVPVGKGAQRLRLLVKSERGITERDVLDVRFVPMTGRAQRE